MPGVFPITGLRRPWLFSSSRSEPALLHELIAELQAVDTVDILVSFIILVPPRQELLMLLLNYPMWI